MVQFLLKKDAKLIIQTLAGCETSTEVKECINANWKFYRTDILYIHRLMEVLEYSENFDEHDKSHSSIYYAREIPKEEITFKNEAEKYWYIRATLEDYAMSREKRAPKVKDLLYLFSELGKASSEKNVRLIRKEELQKKQKQIIDLIKQVKEQLYKHHTVDRIEDSNTVYLASALLFTNDEPDFYINLGKEIMRFDTLEPLVNDSQIMKNFYFDNITDIDNLIKKYRVNNENFEKIYDKTFNNFKLTSDAKDVVDNFKIVYSQTLSNLSKRLFINGELADILRAYKRYVTRNNEKDNRLKYYLNSESAYEDNFELLKKFLSDIDNCIKEKDRTSLLAGENTIDDLVSLILPEDKATSKEVIVSCEKPLLGYLLYQISTQYSYSYDSNIESIANSRKLYTVDPKSRKKLQTSRTTIRNWHDIFKDRGLKDKYMQSDIEKIIAKYFSTKLVKN